MTVTDKLTYPPHINLNICTTYTFWEWFSYFPTSTLSWLRSAYVQVNNSMLKPTPSAFEKPACFKFIRMTEISPFSTEKLSLASQLDSLNSLQFSYCDLTVFPQTGPETKTAISNAHYQIRWILYQNTPAQRKVTSTKPQKKHELQSMAVLTEDQPWKMEPLIFWNHWLEFSPNT